MCSLRLVVALSLPPLLGSLSCDPSSASRHASDAECRTDPECGEGARCRGGRCVPPLSVKSVTTSTWLRDPIVVEFTGDVEETSLTHSSVKLTATTWGADVPLRREVSGRTLILTPLLRPPVPCALTLWLDRTITDPSGTALDPPAPTSWDVPAWQEFGVGFAMFDEVYSPWTVAVDARGWPAFLGGSYQGEAGPWRWLPAGWQQWDVPELAPPGGRRTALAFLPEGDVVVARVAGRSGDHVFTAVHDGQGWSEQVVLNPDAAPGTTQGVAALADPQGRVVVAWVEGTNVLARRLEGGEWRSLGAGFDADGATYPEISLDAAGEPEVVLRNEHRLTYGWGGAYWSRRPTCGQLPGGAVDAATAIYRRSRGGEEFIATRTAPPGASDPNQLTVSRCAKLSSGWVTLQGALNEEGSRVSWFGMELTAEGAPVVLSVEVPVDGARERVHARRWAGDGWEDLGGDLAVAMNGLYGDAGLGIGPDDVIVALIPDDAAIPGRYPLHVIRYNR